MSEIFHRRQFAEEMAAQLLRPGVLDQALLPMRRTLERKSPERSPL